jgi:catechol 2,3-dioxygenase-like lactoylglutathione lyase family enzyme
MLSLQHIQHVGVPVTDLQTSETFYRKLGFETVMSSTFIHNENEGNVLMMKSGSIIMELYQMPENELQEIRERKNGHIDHIAFNVENIEDAYAVLKNAGFDIIEDAPVFLPFWKNGCRYFYIPGPDGERLEFNQIL